MRDHFQCCLGFGNDSDFSYILIPILTPGRDEGWEGSGRGGHGPPEYLATLLADSGQHDVGCMQYITSLSLPFPICEMGQ